MRQVAATVAGQVDISIEQELFGGSQARSSAPEEIGLLERLRQGDEAAFASLVDRHHGALLRLAMAYVSDRSIAEEVVQETWMGVLEGVDRFEGRSSLKTWIFRILTNKAKTRGVRESRHVSFSPLAASQENPEEPAVDPTRFQTRATGPAIGCLTLNLGTRTRRRSSSCPKKARRFLSKPSRRSQASCGRSS